jgi:hypothetical protein
VERCLMYSGHLLFSTYPSCYTIIPTP